MSVYLDHAAGSAIRPVARAAFAAALGEVGNAGSIHGHGQRARAALAEGRERIARSIGTEPIELVLTSGGTEAINLAIKGMFWARNPGAERPRPRIIATTAEHHATLDALHWLERTVGAEIDLIPVDARGVVDLDALDRALRSADTVDGSRVALLTLMLANNEVGSIQPVRAAARLAHAHGVPVHVDAVGAYGQLRVDRRALGVDLLSVAAHKAGGPVGIGALAVARELEPEALIHGGGQQRGLRSGTQDVAAARAWAAAADELVGAPADRAAEDIDAQAVRLAHLRDRLIAGIRAAVPDAVLRGAEPGTWIDDEGERVPARLPGNVHVTVPGTQSDSLLMLLDMAGISVSNGSACQAGVPELSHVLLAMGVEPEAARGALRITLGWSSSDADVDAVLAALPDAVARARRAGLSSREQQSRRPVANVSPPARPAAGRPAPGAAGTQVEGSRS